MNNIDSWRAPRTGRVMALAGIFQATSLVQQMARAGEVDQASFTTSIESLFTIDAPTIEAIYTNPQNLEIGLNALCQQFDIKRARHDIELTHYWLSLLFLERKLIRQAALLEAIRQGIENAEKQASIFSKTHDNVIARLADIYKNTVSTLNPRIMVKGEPHFLNQPVNVNKIRALLLAAIRSTILWRQLGGNRWNLLLGKTAIVGTAKALLKNTTPPVQTSHSQ